MDISINIRLLTGKLHIFQVNENFTVLDLKSQASPIFSIPVNNLVFIYKSLILDDGMKVKDIKYDQNSFIVAANSLLTGDLKFSQNTPNNKTLTDEKKSLNKNTHIAQAQKKINQIKKDVNGNIIPWNIDSLISFIENLHYTEHYARLALEYTKYDLHRAICLLTTGRAIGPDGREHSCNVIGVGIADPGSIPGTVVVNKGSHNNGNSNASDSIDYGGDGYSRNGYIAYEETEEPVVVPVRRSFEEKKLAETMKEFTEEEKQAIARLCYGRDRSIVVQVFMACDKDEALTENCLNTMN